MYLKHLANRTHQLDPVRIQFPDLPPIATLLVQDPESDSQICLRQPPIYESSTEQHVEVLEQRINDARIGKDACWSALNILAQSLLLASGKSFCPNYTMDLKMNI
jgi:hypothetical protein